MTPKIRFDGSTDDWEQRKLGDVCQVTMGQSPDGSTYSDTPSDYILVQGNADLKDGWVSPRIWTTQKTKTAEAGDLIMSVRAPAGSMGKTSYNVVLGRGVAGIKGNEFIYQSLVKMDSDGHWKKLAAGSTFESINSDVVNGAELMVPQDIDEQNKIGDYFASIDALITLHQRKCDALEKTKQYFLQNMFPQKGEKAPKIRLEGFTDDWEKAKLGTLMEFSNGYNGAKESYGRGIPAISVMDILNNDYITYDAIRGKVEIDEKELHRFAVRNGDILFQRSSENVEDAGTSNVYIDEKPAIFGGFVIRGKKKKEYDPVFMKHLLDTGYVRNQIMKSAQGAQHINVSQESLSEVSACLPSIEEQRKIGAFFCELDKARTLQKRKVTSLKSLKKFFLQNMFPEREV